MAKTLKWQFDETLAVLEKEVNEIIGNVTTEELLNKLPPEIPYDETQTAKLTIRKLGDIVWQVSYMIYIDPKTRHFEKVSVKAVTEPSLRLALYEMDKELTKEEDKK